METNNECTNKITAIKQLIEFIRMSYSHMLKEHLLLYENFDRFKTDEKGGKFKSHYYQIDLNYFDEKGKINWKIIRQFMPSDVERYIHEEFVMLNTGEIRLCCLLMFKIPNRMISKILPYSQKSIYTIIHNIKQKTGIESMNELYEKIILKMTLKNEKKQY